MKHPLDPFKYCPKCGSMQFLENNVKSKKCKDCNFTYYFNSSAAVAVFITDRNGRLAVAKRAHDPAKGTLDLPGGFVDLYESAEEALKREILEETRLEIDHPVYLFSLPNVYTYSNFDVHTLDLFFACTVHDISGIIASDDVAELTFIEKQDIKPELFGLDSIRKAVERWKSIC